MQKREPPAFQEYPASILAERNFRLMSLPERGLLFTIRLECWVNGSVPSLPDELAKYLGLNPTDVDKKIQGQAGLYKFKRAAS
jgi:hypothetical protein